MIGFRLWQIMGWTMLHYLWVGAALGAVALLTRRGLRSAAAGVRYLLALGSLSLLSIAPAAIALVVMQNLAPLPHAVPLPVDPASDSETMRLEEVRPTMAAGRPVPAAPTVQVPETRSSERLLAALNLAAMCLPWLWVCGAPLSFALTTAGLLGAERLRRQSRPLEDARITAMCRQLATTLKISYRVSVAICDRIAAPILVGVLRPMILVPAAALAGWAPQQLEMVLLHELAHVRRLDNLVNLLQRIVESLLFFQPMVWVISGWVRREREYCCDELVVARTRQPHVYAEILVTLAETFADGPLRSSSLAHPQAVSSMAERPLIARIRRILKKEEQTMQVSRKAVAAVLGSVLALAIMVVGYCSRPSRAEDALKARAGDKTPIAAPPTAKSATTPAELLKPVVGKNFVVVPFTSELQRAMRRSYENATFFFLINAEPMINKADTRLDLGAVDFKGLHDASQVLVRAGLLKRVIVEANVGPRHLQRAPGNASEALLSYLRDVPPTDDQKTELSGRDDKKDWWKSVVAALGRPPTEQANQRESGLGDDLVKVYPVCTPLSRYFAGDDVDCVIRNMKPLDQLTPEELQAFPARAKAYAAKLGLKQPVRARFVLNGGTSLVKDNRARQQLHVGGDDDAWRKTHGFIPMGESLWDDKQWMSPRLLIKVIGEDGSAVKDAKITAELPKELKGLVAAAKFTRQDDGRWRSGNLPRDDEFTLTVAAPGYQASAQKMVLPEGAKKELEVRLKPVAPKANDPPGKTSAEKPAGAARPAAALTHTGRLVAAELKPADNKPVPATEHSPASVSTVPQALVGTWEGKDKVCAPPENGAPGQIYKDYTPIFIRIAADGSVEGHVGSARLVGCKVKSNRGWFGKTMHLWSDYLICDGRLEGPVYKADRDDAKRSFSIPFDLDGGTLKGGFMLLKPGEYPFPLFPRLQLTKRPITEMPKPKQDKPSVYGMLADKPLGDQAKRQQEAMQAILHLGDGAIPPIRSANAPAFVKADDRSSSGNFLYDQESKPYGVQLHGPLVTNVQLKLLKDLPWLKSLYLLDTQVTDAGLEQLKELAQLEHLVLQGPQSSSIVLEHLKGLNQLHHLELVYTTNPGLEHAKGLTQLRRLELFSTKVTDAGLKHLTGLTQLRELSLEGFRVSGAGLEHLKGLGELQELSFEGTGVTDEVLQKLQRAMPRCRIWIVGTPLTRIAKGQQHLQKTLATPATEKSAATAIEPTADQARAIAEIEKLGGKVTVDEKSPDTPVIGVDLRATKVTDAGLVHLKGLTTLQYLFLGTTQVTDAGLEHLKGLTELRTLDLWQCKVSDAGVECLQAFPQLKSLQLGSTQVTDAGLERVKRLTTLHSVLLSNTQITDAGLQHLKGLTELQTLDLGHTSVSDGGLEHLQGLTRLQTLDLGHTNVTDAGLESVKGLTNLQDLDLTHTQVTDAGLQHLKGLAHLQTLYLNDTKVTDAGLEHLKGLNQLQTLYLRKTQVTDAGLARLQGLAQLTTLDLFATSVTDGGLEHLKELTKLLSLDLGATQVTDAGLAHLKGLTELTALDLFDTEVRDRGLEHLKGLTKLQSLNLRRTYVTPTGMKGIQKVLPNCKIDLF